MKVYSFSAGGGAPRLSMPDVLAGFRQSREMEMRQALEARRQALEEQRMRNQMALQNQRLAMQQAAAQRASAIQKAQLNAALSPVGSQIDFNPYTEREVTTFNPNVLDVKADEINKDVDNGILPRADDAKYQVTEPKGYTLPKEVKPYTSYAEDWNALNNTKFDNDAQKRLAQIMFIKNRVLTPEQQKETNRSTIGKLADVPEAVADTVIEYLVAKPGDFVRKLFMSPDEKAAYELKVQQEQKLNKQPSSYDNIIKKLNTSMQAKTEYQTALEKEQEAKRKQYEIDIQARLKDLGLVKQGKKETKTVKVPKALTDAYSEIDQKTNDVLDNIRQDGTKSIYEKAALAKAIKDRAKQLKDTYMTTVYKPMADAHKFKTREDYKARKKVEVQAAIARINATLKHKQQIADQLAKQNTPEAKLKLRNLRLTNQKLQNDLALQRKKLKDLN